MPRIFRLRTSRLQALALALISLLAVSCAKGAGELTEQDVKTLIQKPWPTARFTWRSIQIAAPRKASSGETAASGLPPSVTVFPVRADYTRVVGDGGRDFTWNYLAYKDDFGTWQMQSNAVPGNHESDLYYVKP